MNNTMIRTAVALSVTGVLVTGCARSPQHLDGQASPAGVATPSSPAAAAPSPARSPSTPPSPVGSSSTPPSTPPSPSSSGALKSSSTLVLGPDGIGGLKLRMTRQEAEATGRIQGYEVEDFTGNCGVSRLTGLGSTVYFTPGLGLSSIHAPDGVRTPEGVRLGSTIRDVQRAYPDWEEIVGGGDTGYGWAETPGRSRNSYRIDVRDGKVTSVALTTEGQKCIE